ncbi:MAG: type II toxin-antitoxin system VapC family toxin [Phycisphaerales bacterium]
MRPSVYIETSVISYLTAQASRDLIVAAHQQLTVEWWEKALPAFEPFVSPVVLEEIARGDPDAAKRRMKAVAVFEVLGVVAEIRDLAEQYFGAIDLPEKARADAYHLALAVWYGMDYLVTWNCTHIAGGRVKSIVQRVNAGRGFASPIICTPEELMET